MSGQNPQGSEAPTPPHVAELAAACVRFVERATGVKLDFEPETLGVLDHWIRDSRAEASQKPDVARVVAQAAGAYFGEVVRRRYASWWRAEGDDASRWRVELAEVYLAFHPALLIVDALRAHEPAKGAEGAEGEEGDYGALELEEADRDAIAQRLAELPHVTPDEFYAPTTRLEVIEVAVEAIRARRIAEDMPVAAALRPDDYEDEAP